MAGALALHKLGEGVVIKAQGAPYADAKMQQQSFERVMSSLGRSTGRKTRHLFDTREDLAQARGEKYLKMLKAFLRRFPVDLNHITEPEQPVREAVLSA